MQIKLLLKAVWSCRRCGLGVGRGWGSYRPIWWITVDSVSTWPSAWRYDVRHHRNRVGLYYQSHEGPGYIESPNTRCITINLRTSFSVRSWHTNYKAVSIHEDSFCWWNPCLPSILSLKLCHVLFDRVMLCFSHVPTNVTCGKVHNISWRCKNVYGYRPASGFMAVAAASNAMAQPESHLWLSIWVLVYVV